MLETGQKDEKADFFTLMMKTPDENSKLRAERTVLIYIIGHPVKEEKDRKDKVKGL